jgi:hypothetical protein
LRTGKSLSGKCRWRSRGAAFATVSSARRRSRVPSSRIHMLELGRSFYDPNSWVGVAGVDTLVRRPADDPWFRQVTLWQTDEAHHVLA